MEDLSEELRKNLKSGAVLNISYYLRKFEENSLQAAPTTEIYILHLFAYYLTNNLQDARLLWKRIPSPKSGELEKVWEIGKSLIRKDYSKAIHLINSFHWIVSADIVLMLRRKLIEDTRIRISKSYISIELNKLAEILSLNDGEIQFLIDKWGWKVENNFVLPVSAPKNYVRNVEDRDVLLITQLVAFLEQKNHIGINN
jgi:CSN8/PSMD8/EIF3K family